MAVLVLRQFDFDDLYQWACLLPVRLLRLARSMILRIFIVADWFYEIVPSASVGETMRGTSLPRRIMSAGLLPLLNHCHVGDSQPMDLDVAVDEEQRTNLFFGRAFVRGESFPLVIDSGCCANIIGESLVTKLELPCTVHPTPYELVGVNGAGMQVSKISRVSFTVQDYGDTLDFDVVPTSSVYVLLGRPWQFDLRVNHDGHKNIYTFAKNQMKITLLPLTRIEIVQLLNDIRGAAMAARGSGQN